MAYNIKLICLKCSLILFPLLFFQPVYSQYDFTRVKALLKQNEKLLGGNAITLIWKDGKLVFQDTIGEFTPKTQAPIASCSKWLTAALVMTFVDQGKIALDDKVSQYIPFFEKYMKGYITIRQCLSHTTGIEDEGGMIKKILQRNRFKSLEEEVNSFVSKRAIAANPGEQFWYGEVGLNIAGRVLEIVGKKSFDRLIMERLFRPLKMRNTTFANENYEIALNPSGGARSTALDYMNFMVMLMNRGQFEGKTILTEASVNEMMKIQTGNAKIGYTPLVAAGYPYGLGCWIQEMDGQGKATVISSPGLFGTWPLIDRCRGYACIIFVKTLLENQRKELYLDIKKMIDQQIPSACNAAGTSP